MKKALIIGFNNYPKSKLSGCINDAKSIKDILSKNYDNSPNFECKLLVDEVKSYSLGQVKNEISSLFNGYCDTALLYFSGHGLIQSTGGYIVTTDYYSGNEGISMDEILILANNSKARNKVIILDCCHSGAFGSPSLSNGSISQISEGVTILTASRASEYSIESGGHGLFTSLLLEALNGSATDLMGNITLASIYSFIDSALGAWDQRPIFKTNISTFSPIRKVKPPIDITLLRNICSFFPTPDYEYHLDPSYEFTCESQRIDKHVVIFKQLQKLQSVGLVIPSNEEYMYFAAINSKSCKLTSLGHRYWRLAKEDKI